MSAIVFVVGFMMLVLLPCGAAIFGLSEQGWRLADLDGHAFLPPRALGRMAAPVLVTEAERPVTKLFVIRSFPKGISQKRNVIRDGLAPVVAIDSVLITPAAASAFIAAESAPAHYAVPVTRPLPQVWHEVFAEPAIAAHVDAPARTSRRTIMMRMLEDKAEAAMWTARVEQAERALAGLLQAEVRDEELLRTAESDVYAATDAARTAARRVERAEALLQRRADVEISLPNGGFVRERRKRPRAA